MGLDPDLKITCFNPAAERLFQKKGTRFRARRVPRFSRSQEGAVLTKYRYAVENGTPTQFESSFRRDPLAGMYDFTLFPLEDGISILCRGRSNEHRPEDSTKDDLPFTEMLLNAIPNPIFYKNANGVYLGCNDAFEAFIGLSR